MLKLLRCLDHESGLGRQKITFTMLLVKTLWVIMTSYFFWRKRNADVLRTIELEPRHFGVLSGKELTRMALLEWSGAIVTLEAALRINPLMPRAIRYLKYARKRLKESMTWMLIFRFSQLKFFRHFTLNSPLEIAQQFCLCLRISTLNQPLSLKN